MRRPAPPGIDPAAWASGLDQAAEARRVGIEEIPGELEAAIASGDRAREVAARAALERLVEAEEADRC